MDRVNLDVSLSNLQLVANMHPKIAITCSNVFLDYDIVSQCSKVEHSQYCFPTQKHTKGRVLGYKGMPKSKGLKFPLFSRD